MACVGAALLVSGCEVRDDSVPEGALARVGSTVLTPQDLAAEQAQLGAYGQLRFRGEEGNRALLEALVETELLAQEAVEHGLGDDPRVQFALLEEIAEVHRSSELQRRVPYEVVASDTEALRAYYDAHPEEFTRPERRSMQGVAFKELEAAEQALEQLQTGSATLEDFGEVFATPLQARDDAEHPTFHRLLFDPEVGDGDWLKHPALLAETLLVGRVQTLEPAALEPFDDPAVQEKLVAAVRAPLLRAAEQQLLRELRERYPETPVSP